MWIWEQANKQHGFVVSNSRSCLDFQHQLPSMMEYRSVRWNKLFFFFYAAFGHCAYHSKRKVHRILMILWKPILSLFFWLECLPFAFLFNIMPIWFGMFSTFSINNFLTVIITILNFTSHSWDMYATLKYDHLNFCYLLFEHFLLISCLYYLVEKLRLYSRV